MTLAVFHDFPGLENGYSKFHDFPGGVVTLYKISVITKHKKHLKNVGPIRYCETPLHCQSPGVASRTPAIAIAQAACDVHNDDNA